MLQRLSRAGNLLGQYLLVEAQAQSKAPAALLIPMLSAQQVLVEVWQGQAGPEVGAQHADRRQHNEGVGHGTWVGQGASQKLPRPGLGHGSHTLHSSNPPTCTGVAQLLSSSWSYLPASSQVAGVWTNGQSHPAYSLLVFCPSPTFEGHCPDALLALDVPDAHSLVM